MNKLKLLAIGLVLSLSGAVYAFSGTKSSMDSCPLGKDRDCCNKAEASCCKDDSCPLCKTKKTVRQ